jgi:predicted amidohydrolase
LELAINRYYINDAKRIINESPNLTVIGITGSYGKTSVKYFLAKLLAAKYETVMTPENFNTTLGVVRTVRQSIRATTEMFVCEMGARNVGDIKEICELAHNKGLKVMVHCNGSPSPMAEILSCLEGGDVLTHAYHGGKNTARDDGFSSIIEAKGRGVIIDAGLAGHVHTDFSVFSEAVRLGATPDVISTDVTNRSAFVRGGKYSLNMCMSIAEDMGMSEEAVFRAVTSAPALAMGRSWGRLTVGGVADITVLDREGEGYSLTDSDGNLIENKRGYRCLLTLSDGQIVYKN